MAVMLYKYVLLHLAVLEQTKRVASIVRYLVFKALLLKLRRKSPLSLNNSEKREQIKIF
jgi:hypothetical protein